MPTAGWTEGWMQYLEESRDAHSAAYLAWCIPDEEIDGVPLSDIIKTQDDLYSYLLLDTRISAIVDTTWVAETMTSLQQFINQSLSADNNEVDEDLNSTLVEQSRSGGFLYDWTDYNQSYDTWSGKERLQYYPSTYIYPTPRSNQTLLFTALDQTISQGYLNFENVERAVTKYINDFVQISTLTTVAGYQTGTNSTKDSQDTVYFIGQTQDQPYKYYLRRCDLSTRNNAEIPVPTVGAWSEWIAISAPIENPINNSLASFFYGERLYICWLSKETDGSTMSEGQAEATYTNWVNIYYRDSGGQWSSFRKIPLPSNIQNPTRIAGASNISGTSGAQKTFIIFIEATNAANGQWTQFAYINDSSWAIVGLQPPPAGFIYKNVAQSFDVGQVQIGDTFLVGASTCTVSTITPNSIMVTAAPLTLITYSQWNQSGAQIGSATPIHSVNGVFTFPYTPTTYCFTFENSNPADFKLYVPPANYDDFAATYFARPYFSFTQNWFYLDPTLPISISTNSGPYFYEKLQLQGIEGLLSYNVQTHPIDFQHPITTSLGKINFNSSYGLYFWEIFFYIPYLVAERYLINRKYNNSLSWYEYIFSSKGYRSLDGQLDTTSTGEVRYWNVVPLQEDDSWNTAIPPTMDANLIGMNDPMVFKLTIFLRNVNTLIEQGDDYYRQLQREKLARAKICYLQAERLLGQKPQINVNNSWPNSTLNAEAALSSADIPDTSSNLLQAFVSYVAGEYGNFKPPYNEELLSYWDKLEQRFYNLRHNLSIQGQPLSLPTYATPVSPMELQMRQNTGNGPGSNTVPPIVLSSQYRFIALLEKARTAVNSVTQFGSELLSLLEKHDNESLTLLLQEQQQKITELTEGVQDINTAMQKDTLTSLEEAEKSAAARAEFYHELIKNGLSAEEKASIDEQKEATDQIQVAGAFYLTAALASMMPNIFGTSFGGVHLGAMSAATGLTYQFNSQILQTAANINAIDASYDRRAQEWDLQEKNAQGEVAQLGAQIAATKQSITMSEKQSALYAQELKNQKAVHQQQITRFTGLTLYGWLVSRLSSLYYQLYSATLPLCLATKQALNYELGNPRNANYFAAPAWDDLYRGLLAGQGLQLELQRMENAYLEQNRRGLEIQRAVSLNDLIVSGDPLKTFSSVVAEAYYSPGVSTPPIQGVSLNYNSAVKALLVRLEVSSLDLESACNSNDRTGRFATISVTLPTLLGPYQTVDATLEMGGTTVALSRGLDDPGIFALDFNDPRYLPFEGLSVKSGLLTLSFYQANPATTTPPAPPGQQWALVQNLVDVIYQMRYTLKDS